MRPSRASRLCAVRRALLALTLSTASARSLTAQQSREVSGAARPTRGDSLRLGDLFPSLVGSALSGKPISIPDTTSSRYTAVVFGFSRQGGEDAGRWGERLMSDSATRGHVMAITVAELGGAPRFMRGLIAAGIKRGTPPDARDHMMVLDHDDALWKRRLAVSETSHAYVVLLAPNGRVRWRNDGAFDEARFARLRKELVE
jgi:hypothetical protein